jgi:hypothetical protein
MVEALIIENAQPIIQYIKKYMGFYSRLLHYSYEHAIKPQKIMIFVSIDSSRERSLMDVVFLFK